MLLSHLLNLVEINVYVELSLELGLSLSHLFEQCIQIGVVQFTPRMLINALYAKSFIRVESEHTIYQVHELGGDFGAVLGLCSPEPLVLFLSEQVEPWILLDSV